MYIKNKGECFTVYGYVYLTTNKINGKVYVGQHKSDSYDESYFGSGQKIREAFDKYGLDNFTNEILIECDNQDEMNENEKKYIKDYNSLYQFGKGYNISGGGNGGFVLNNCSDEIWSKRMETYREQNAGERNPNYGNGDKIAGDKNPSKRPEVREKLSKKLSGSGNPMYGKHPKFPNRRYNLICKNCGKEFEAKTHNKAKCDTCSKKR